MARLRYLQNKRSGVAGTICKGLTDIYFRDDDMYIGPWEDGGLDMVSDDNIWLFSDDIYFVGDVHYYGTIHETSTAEFDVLLTDPTTAANALHALIDAGGAWTAGNMVAVRGKVDISGGLAVYSATGVWAGVDFVDAVSAKSGLVCALNAEVVSDNASKPNAIVYIQSLPGVGASFVDVPYLVFSETAGGTGSNILFEVGHKEAGTVPTITSGTLFYGDTLQIAVNKTAGNRTAYYIPLSTAEASFTTAYPIVTTYATLAIDISSTVTGIDITDASTAGININGTCASGIIIGTGTTTGISITGATTDAIVIVTTGQFRMGTMAVGIPVTTGDTTCAAMQVHTEPVAFGAYVSTFGIRSRYQVSTAQTQIVTMEAVDARLRVKANMAGGVHVGVQGYIEISESPTLTTGQTNAGGFTVEAGAGTTLSSGYLCGVHIDSATADSVSVSSVTYAGLRISTGTSSKQPWTYGIIFDASAAATAISIGTSTTANIAIAGTNVTGIAMTGTYSTAAISIATTFANHADYAIYIAGTTASTGGTNNPLYVSSIPSAAGVVARAAEFLLAPTAKMGGWGSAVKGYLNLTGASGSSGLLAGVCAEVLLPDETLNGSIGILELELVCPASGFVYGTPGIDRLAFIIMNATGVNRTVYDDSGSLIAISGLTDETGHIWFDNTLKISIDNSAWYLPMSSAQASYTTAYPIVSTNLNAFAATSTMANTATNVIAATVTDSGTRTSGDARGLRVAYTIDSAASLTGTAAAVGCGITFTVSDPCPYVYGYKLYLNTVSDKTMTQLCGHYVYMEDVGNAVQHVACAALNRNVTTNVGIASDCFLYMRNHGGTAATAFIKSIGTATYWLDFQDGDLGVPLSAWSSGTTVSHRLRVRMPDGTSTYMHLFTS